MSSTREQNVTFLELLMDGERPIIGWTEPDGSEYVSTIKGDFYILPNGLLMGARDYQVSRKLI